MDETVLHEHVCDVPGCDRAFLTPHGVVMHKNRAHPETLTAKPRRKERVLDYNPDEVFELVGRATEALFPAGIPTSRIIEIAELQKAMLKVVTR